MPSSQTNPNAFHSYDLKTLQIEHQALENRLLELDRHRSLSPEEKYEAALIKKRTLFIKDRIHSLNSRD